MNKSCIITVTQGDFNYLNEWIEYHHNIGVDLLVIGFNGKSDEISKLPKYDYVKYIDFTVNNNSINGVLDIANNNYIFGSYIDNDEVYNNTNIEKLPLQTRLLNILHTYVLNIFYNIKYTIIIDTDEFISLVNEKYDNINNYLDDYLDFNKSVMVKMEFYSDNNLIYYENKPCLNRFNKLSINKYARGVGGCKTIINNFYDDIKDIQILSAHTCSKHENDYILTRDDGIVLKHIFTKSLEEWIMKMTHNIDNSYMARWHGYIFNEYFKWNEITNEKLDAIDDLLNKYNIKYNILIEELYGEFLQKYIERNIDNVNTISCITFIDTENIDTLNNWIDYHYKLGIKKFFVGYCCDYSLLPKNDFIVYVNTKNEDNIYDKLLNMAKMDNNIQYVLSLSVNQYINIKNNDNHLIYILKKYFSHYNSSIQIKEEYTDEQPNEKCSICINIKHKDIDKIQMIDKYCCSLYIDGYVIDPNILTLTTHNK
jgi:hypothetical protein